MNRVDPGSPCLPALPRSFGEKTNYIIWHKNNKWKRKKELVTWLSILRDSCKEVPMTWSPPSRLTSSPSLKQWTSQSFRTDKYAIAIQGPSGYISDSSSRSFSSSSKLVDWLISIDSDITDFAFSYVQLLFSLFPTYLAVKLLIINLFI